jgi:predicted RNase H-like HicB family nuclease
MPYQMIVEKTKTGFSTYSPDFPVFTTGGSKGELVKNAVEAFNLWFEDEGQVLCIDQIKLIFN